MRIEAGSHKTPGSELSPPCDDLYAHHNFKLISYPYCFPFRFSSIHIHLLQINCPLIKRCIILRLAKQQIFYLELKPDEMIGGTTESRV
jgi:hypothetical protein